MDNTSVLIFKAITEFVSELNNEFGSKHKNIALYNRLLEKTGIVNVGPVNKHIDCFRVFFSKNQKAMEEKNTEFLTDSKISYSDRVFIDLLIVLKQSSKENAKVIWQHLLNIWCLIDPSSQARRLLNEALKDQGDNKDATAEEDFLTNIINKVEQTVSKDKVDHDNPMAAISTLMQSGVMTDLVNGMQKGLSDGSLNVGKLMSSVQGMIGKMGGPNGGQGGGQGGMPDLSQMMSMLGPMMGNMMGGMGGGSNGNGGNLINEEKKE